MKTTSNQSPTEIQLRPPTGAELLFWILKLANLILACKWHFLLAWLLGLIRFCGSHSYFKFYLVKQFHKFTTLGTCMYHSFKGMKWWILAILVVFNLWWFNWAGWTISSSCNLHIRWPKAFGYTCVAFNPLPPLLSTNKHISELIWIQLLWH